jgi:hypothetical protein
LENANQSHINIALHTYWITVPRRQITASVDEEMEMELPDIVVATQIDGPAWKTSDYSSKTQTWAHHSTPRYIAKKAKTFAHVTCARCL